MRRQDTCFDAVVFDMDGVIIDSKEHVEAFWKEKLRHYGIEASQDELELKFHGRPARLIIDDLFDSLSESERSQMAEECARYDASVTRFSMMPGVERFLKRCAGSGISVGLVTSALPGKVERMLEGLNFPSPFKVEVTANMVQKGKPDPECYLLAAEKLGVNPQKIIVFEDSISGIKAAVGSGATVVGINQPRLSGLLKEAGAVMVMPGFSSSELVNGQNFAKLIPDNQRNEMVFTVSSSTKN